MSFDFKTDYTLEDERVLLRPLAIGDVEYLLPYSIQEPELWDHSSVHAIGEAGLKNYLLKALKGRKDEKEYPFIVFDKHTNEYAGSTRFYDMQLNAGCLQLGYTWYGKEFQGTGLNKHCKYLLLQFAFEQLRMERVEFRADNTNLRSIAAMKSIGCSVEGILRSNVVRHNGTRRDSIVLSILKPEWEEQIKRNLLQKLQVT
ncbi:MAG: GNAT family protein [Bacteroidia bacterium]|jgi:RimJ/RimL family protein N-acetyltransferase